LASGDSESIPNFGREIQKRKSRDRITAEQKTVFNFYHIIKGMLWNREIPKQCKITIYKAYFKLITMYETEIWSLWESNKRIN
jgi:hypothetical protein